MRHFYPQSRVTALTIFYDEPLELLDAHFRSLYGVVDHVIAVDGAFGLYPDGKHASDPSQGRLIAEICRELDLGLTLHTPTAVWWGNEVEKRNFTLELAESVTFESGWYLSTDVDEVITHVAFDWWEQLSRLADEGWSAMDIGIRETRVIPGFEDLEPTWNPIRNVYRAYRGLAYGPTHWTLHAPDPFGNGKLLCVRGLPDEQASAYDGTHLLKFDHRQERSEERNVAKRKYYVLREEIGIEKAENQPSKPSK